MTITNTARRIALIAALVSGAALSGCAGVSADVQASRPDSASSADETAGRWESPRNYALARTALQDASGNHQQYETSVRTELEKYGFAATSGPDAHYLLSVAYDTQP